jgi:hypothetical protein
MWECAEIFCDELLGTWYPSTRYRRGVAKLHLSSRGSWQQLVRQDEVLSRISANVNAYHARVWREIITDYNMRRLTVPGDRIVALAGVARAFQVERGWTYLAGAWAESLAYQLLWSTEINSDKVANRLVSRNTTVPSWSWLKHPDHGSARMRSEVHWENEDAEMFHKTWPSKVDYFQWPGQPQNYYPETAFYDFTGLRITLTLPTFTTSFINSWKQSFECKSLEKQIYFALRTFHHAGLVSVDYTCDNPVDVETHPKHMLLALIVERKAVYEPKDSGHRYLAYQISGLGLQPGEEDGTWERHGFWTARIYYQTSPYSEVRVRHFKPSFLSFEGVKLETLTLV